MFTKELISYNHFEIADRLSLIWKDRCFKNGIKMCLESSTADFIDHSIKYGPYYVWFLNKKMIGIGGFSRYKHNEVSVELLPDFYDLGFEVQILNFLIQEAKEIGISFLNAFVFPNDDYNEAILTKSEFFNNGPQYFKWSPKVPLICYRKNIKTDHLN